MPEHAGILVAVKNEDAALRIVQLLKAEKFSVTMTRTALGVIDYLTSFPGVKLLIIDFHRNN